MLIREVVPIATPKAWLGGVPPCLLHMVLPHTCCSLTTHVVGDDAYATPVQRVKETVGSGPFNVNELLAVLRLLRYVCSHKDAELARLVKRAHARGQIRVPNSDCCLVATSACVHTHTCPPQLLARSTAPSAHE